MGRSGLETEAASKRRAEAVTVAGRKPVGAVCPLCGGEGEPVGVKDGICLRECCGCLLAWAWESEDDYARFYADVAYFHSAQQIEEGHPTTVERDQEHLKASRNRVKVMSGLYDLPYGTRLLDVGAGGGSFVAACKEVGWEAFGLEPCTELARWAWSQGRNVYAGDWHSAQGDWEVICLHDVLEHLVNPGSCLAYLRAHLTETGLLIVEFPEWECAQALREGLAWRHVLPKQHPCLYSDRAAQEMFLRAGLQIEALMRPLRGSIGKITYYLGQA